MLCIRKARNSPKNRVYLSSFLCNPALDSGQEDINSLMSAGQQGIQSPSAFHLLCFSHVNSNGGNTLHRKVHLFVFVFFVCNDAQKNIESSTMKDKTELTRSLHSLSPCTSVGKLSKVNTCQKRSQVHHCNYLCCELPHSAYKNISGIKEASMRHFLFASHVKSFSKIEH